jgi:hypothetical protein
MTVRFASSVPIDRRRLDTFRKPFRILFGAVFLGYTGYAVALWVHEFTAPVVGPAVVFSIPITYMLGFLAALLIMVAEWYLAESRWYWYAIPFIPDVWFTYDLTESWVRLFVDVHMAGEPVGIIQGVTVGVSLLIAVVSARFGEILLFGKRRKDGHP